MKTKLRRLTAMVLAVSMVASMIGIIPAFAANSSSEDQIAQGGGDYFYYAQDGFLSTTYDGLGGVSWNTPTPVTDPVVTAADGAVEISKTISPTNVENQFEIELMVKTTEELEKLEVGEDAAVVLVMDVSGSMLYNMEGTMDSATGKLVEGSNTDTNTRIYAAKAAATNFIESFADNATATSSRMATIVTFTGDENPADDVLHIDDGIATVSTGWTDVNASETTYDKFVDAIDDISIMTATEAEEYDYNVRETNIYAGLAVAYDQLDEIKNSGIENVYVILLSDGSPDEPIANQDEMQALQASYNSNKGFTDAFGNTYRPDDYDDTNSSGLNQAIAANAAAAIKDHSTNPTLYTVGFATDSTQNTWLANSIASSSSAAFTSDDASELTAQFDIIASEIKKAAEAWTVTDPMGTNITLESTLSDLNDDDNVVTLTDNGFSWNLLDSEYTKSEKETVGNTTTTTFTYTLEYTISLDTDASTFEEGTYYLTNGRTYLSYYLTGTSATGTTGTVDFLVPAVCGDYPDDYWCQVNYYLQTGVNADGEYTYELASKGSYTEEDIEKYDTVTANTRNYENYTRNDNASDLGAIEITTRGQEIAIYYDRNTTTATVNHYYYTVTKADDGTVVGLDDTTVVYENLVYIGENYEAKTANSSGYTQITTAPDTETGAYTATNDTDNVTIELVEDGSKNVVNYYYVSTVDSRTDVTVVVEHVYTSYSWALNKDGRYEEVSQSSTDTDATVTQKYGTSFTATAKDKTDYTLLTVTEDMTIPSLVKNSTITLNYEKHEENPNALVDVVVNHNYQVETTYVNEAGDVTTSTITENTAQDTFSNYRVGETFVATAKTNNGGNSYSQTTDDANLTVTVLAEGNTITINYLREVSTLEKTTVSVTHNYTLYTEIIDDETGAVKTDITTGSYSESVAGTWYEGQFFTATTINAYNGDSYEMTSVYASQVLDGMTIELGDTNEIIINYELREELGDAKVTVTHTYTTYLKSYIDGVLAERLESTESGDSVTYEGSDGERYTAEEEVEFDGDTYVRSDSNNLTVTLNENLAQSVDLSYKRVIERYVDTTVTVNHIFTTTTSFIDENGEVDTKITTETEVDTAETGTLYVGMSYTAVENATMGDRVGFTADAANSTSLVLVEDSDKNVINLYYAKSDDTKVDASVQVEHYYTTYTINLVDGQPETTITTGYEAESQINGMYEGQFYTATAKPQDFTQITADEDLTVTLGADENVIKISYEKTVDYTLAATLDVTHIYTTKYETGMTSTITKHDQQIGSWATVTHTFNVDTNEDLYEVTDIDSDNDSVDEDDYTIVLEEGENVITIEYYRYVDDRTPTTVTVNHIYTTVDLYDNSSVENGKTTDIYQAYVEDETYTTNYVYNYTIVATEDDAEDVTYTYQYESGDKTIEIDPEDVTQNVITINYVREIDTTPEVEEDDTPSTPSTTYYTLTVSYVDEDGNEIADGSSSRKAKGNSYSTTQKSIDGYTFLEMDATSDAASGTMNSSKDVIYVYTADVTVDVPEEDVPLSDIPETDTTETDIPETDEEIVVEIPVEDVPLSDIPETDEEIVVEIPVEDVPLSDIPEIEVEIPVEDVPLSDIPQTGDDRNLAFLAGIASFSAIGLAILVKVELDDKKRTSK